MSYLMALICFFRCPPSEFLALRKAMAVGFCSQIPFRVGGRHNGIAVDCLVRATGEGVRYLVLTHGAA